LRVLGSIDIVVGLWDKQNLGSPLPSTAAATGG
jgi:hypothetical protein